MDQENAIKIAKIYIDFLIKNGIEIQKAYLFGSYAKGNFHQDSDIDLALIIAHLENSFDMQINLMKMRRKFDTRLEPHPFNAQDFSPSIPLIHEIMCTGIQIV